MYLGLALLNCSMLRAVLARKAASVVVVMLYLVGLYLLCRPLRLPGVSYGDKSSDWRSEGQAWREAKDE